MRVGLTQENGTEDDVEVSGDLDISCDEQGPICDVLVDLTGSEFWGELLAFLLGTPLKLAIIFFGALILNRLTRAGADRVTKRLASATESYGEGMVADRSVERAQERATSIGSLLRSLGTSLILAIAIILSLEVIGISVLPVIASAGVLGLAIGFGAQSVVEDLLRGLFMLGEDQFGVGDRVDVGVVNGTVERVTLRTAVIRDADGTLWHVPNSEINYVANEAQETSRASVVVGISYTADIGDAIRVLQAAADEAAAEPEWSDVVTRDPEVQGVQELGGDAVNLRVVTWVEAGSRRSYERYLRRVLKDALDDADIEMPNRQVDVWLRSEQAPAA